MRSIIKRIDPTWPIIDLKTGLPNHQMRLFLLEIGKASLLIGRGSPEGVVEAQQGAEYMDENGLTGSVKYIKQRSNIGGDRTLGWVAIG